MLPLILYTNLMFLNIFIKELIDKNLEVIKTFIIFPELNNYLI